MKPLNIKSVLVSLGLGLGAVALAYIFPIGLIIMPALLAFAGTVWGYGGLAISWRRISVSQIRRWAYI